MNVYIEPSGSISIYYKLTFYCNPSGDPIDIVDIGLPNKSYNLSSAEANLDGARLTRIARSEYVDPGIEVHLGEHRIGPGRSGSLEFQVECGRVLFQDTEDDSYASFRFSPTWFASQFARGKTDLRVSFHFPPGVGPDETKWHRKKFDSHSRDDEDRIVFTWADASASPSAQYVYGVSFPKAYVASGSITKTAARQRDWGRTIERSMPVLFGLFSVLLTFGIMAAAVFSQKRRLMQYLPPTLSIEGVGIKRGLTAVEAAVLLEKPLDKVCTMVLFGLLKKGRLKVAKAKPLRLEVAESDAAGLHDYESGFLAAVDKKGRISESKLRKMIISLIKSTNQKMKGFSRRETRDYYRSIIDKAWKQVSASEASEVASDVFGRELEWLLMDPSYDTKMTEVLGGRTIVVPGWYPVSRGVAPSGSPRIAVPSLPGSDFANSVVKSVEGFAQGLVSKVESFTAGITKSTNPPKTGSWSGSGGSGCACACACAGCACACAGGGR